VRHRAAARVGFQLARAFRADPRLSSTVLVAVSGYALEGDVQRVLAAGLVRTTSRKPASPEEVAQIVRDVSVLGTA